MNQTNPNYPIVEVVWIDAEEYGETGWNSTKEILKEAKKPCPTMHSLGYLIYKGKQHIALLSTHNNVVCSTIEKIPMSFVIEINELIKKELPDADL